MSGRYSELPDEFYVPKPEHVGKQSKGNSRKGRAAQFVIRDGQAEIGTGCGAGDGKSAEKRFQAYLAEKHQPAFNDSDPAKVPIADVLDLYGRERAPMTTRPDVFA